MGRFKAKSDYEELRNARIVENQVFSRLKRRCFLQCCLLALQYLHLSETAVEIAGAASYIRAPKNLVGAAVSEFIA